jgi:hypothetical protein
MHTIIKICIIRVTATTITKIEILELLKRAKIEES